MLKKFKPGGLINFRRKGGPETDIELCAAWFLDSLYA